jgi:peptide methionine sulfoxide reductase msrA/msrB
MPRRIHHPSKRSSHLTLWLGLLAAVAVVAAVLFYGNRQAEQKKAGTFNYLKPVPSDSVLRSTLKADQYHVTRENGTETAFSNEYWDNQRAGIYVDVITYDPLFSSTDKFDAGTGRPTFTKPISPDRVFEQSDSTFGMQRTEVRATKSNSHLGHVFADPTSPTGRRYAVNSAALRFIPLDKMEVEGYGKFLSLFSDIASTSPKPETEKR